MTADLFEDTREALIDTGRRAGDREPIRQHAKVTPGGAAPGRVESIPRAEVACDTEAAQTAARPSPVEQPEGANSAPSGHGPTPSASRARALCGGCGSSTPWILQGNGEDSGFVDCEHMRTGHRINARSGCAFTPSKWEPIDGKRLAQAGIDQAVAAADSAIAGWSDFALEFVRLYAQRNRGKQYIGHDIVQASIAEVAQPPNAKAWGGPIQRAARAGYIKRIGFAEDPNRHGNPVPLWETA